MAQQEEIMLSTMRQHQQDMQGLKMQYEAYFQAVRDECAVQVQLMTDKHKEESRALQDEITRLTQLVTTLSMSVDQSDRAGELDLPATKEMATLHTIQQLQDEVKEEVLILKYH
jgi:alkyl hydroperoxide reductase subunit AhpF